MNKDTRSNEELNRIIAEWCGVKCEQCADGHWDLWIGQLKLGVGRGLSEDHAWAVFCPRYCTDLNAIHGAENKLDHNQLAPYCELLSEIGEREGECYSTRSMAAYCAAARQRSEALVAVIESQTK